MNRTAIQVIAAEQNQDLRDHAAAIRLAREARRTRRSRRAQRAFFARRRPRPRSADPAVNPCPAVSAR